MAHEDDEEYTQPVDDTTDDTTYSDIYDMIDLGMAQSSCKDYRLTEFGNYNNDGTFAPEDLTQQLHRYPSVDDNLRAADNRVLGKGRLISELMDALGIEIFIDHYQIGWIWKE